MVDSKCRALVKGAVCSLATASLPQCLNHCARFQAERAKIRAGKHLIRLAKEVAMLPESNKLYGNP